MTLLAPLFLAGLVAVGLPLWLHRLSSTNPNRRPFSSLMFLEAGEPRRVLAKKLQYLLLLALRIAVLVALVLAFVQPAFWRNPSAASASDQRQHVIVMDVSASMLAGDRWARARDEATDLIDSLPDGDPAQLIAAGRTLELVGAPTTDKAVLRQGVVSLEPGVFHLDFGQMTRSLDGVLRSAELPAVLHFVTDAQAAGLPTRFAELAPTEPVEIDIRSVGETGEPNWTIESLSGSAVTGELAAAVHSFAPASADKLVRLELNGTTVEEQTVRIDAGMTADVGFAPLTLSSGVNRVRVSLLPADELAADDARMLALKRPVPRPVLVVSGDLRRRDTLFLTSAMDTLEALALSPETIAPGDLAAKTLSDYSFVVVADAAALSNADSDRLRDYVTAGGGLLLALGPRSVSLPQVPVTEESFTPTAARTGAGGDGLIAIGAMDTTHPALRGLDTLRAARFTRYAGVVPAPEDRVLISFETGDPLLIERSLGDGRVLLFTSSLNRDWNDLPLEPVYVPFVAGLADHLLGGAGFSSEAALGSTLALRALGMQGGQIFDPAGDAALGLGGRDDVLLDQIGFYELVGGGRTELVAVNFDARESDLTPAAPETLARWEGLGRPVADAATAAAAAAGEPVLNPVGRWLLVLLLLALAMESWIGNWHLRVRRGMAA